MGGPKHKFSNNNNNINNNNNNNNNTNNNGIKIYERMYIIKKRILLADQRVGRIHQTPLVYVVDTWVNVL